MSLPYSHIDKINLNVPDHNKFEDVIENFRQSLRKNDQVINLHSTDNGFQFSFKSLFTIQYKIEIIINEMLQKEIAYEIKLNKLINVCIVLVIFTAFFSSFGVTGFLWFSAILTLVFFSINLIVVNNQIQAILKSAITWEENKRGIEEIMSPEQMQWIKDNSKCPACGEDITEYDWYCPECGLKLSEKVLQGPFDISKYKHKRIKYYYKEKKKAKND
jgi:hypothetical protein